MRTRFLIPGLTLAVALSLAAPSHAEPAPEAAAERVIPQHRAIQLPRLLRDTKRPATLVFGSPKTTRDTVRFTLNRVSETGRKPVGEITLSPRGPGAVDGQASVSFQITTRALEPSAEVRDVLSSAVKSIIARDRGNWYTKPPPERVVESGPIGGPDPPRGAPESSPFDPLPLILFGVLLIGIAIYAWRQRVSEVVSVHFKATHLLPTLIQVCLFGYWALYWRHLPDQLPLMGIQIVYAYVLECTLSVGVFRRWRLSFGPLPIVLSTNLFVQFPASAIHMPLMAITIAIASKVLIRRQGRHIFNPSALGLAVIGVLNLVWPGLGYGDIAAHFNLPPNMTEMIVLLGLLAQTRVPIVLVSIGALIPMALFGPIAPDLAPSPEWAPVTLVLALLLTDPATSPRTAVGRLIFGATCGIIISGLSIALTLSGFSDFYAKVIPVPLLNAMVPSLDRLGTRLQPLMKTLAPRYNLAHVGCWVLFIIIMLSSGVKRDFFRPDVHRNNQTRFLVQGPNGEITCEHNALFCSPFSFGHEIGCWIKELGDPKDRCGAPPRAPEPLK